MSWTTDQILALAPDSASSKAGQGLATTRKWQNLGRDERALWGECQGSGSSPYQTQVDLSGPAFKCSCPSRKFPCKHGLALMLLYAGQEGAFAEGSAPKWVEEWIASRARREEQKAAKIEGEKKADPTAQAKRAAQREAKVAAGMQDLDLWLRDLVRHGLAAVQGQPYSYWEQPAARLVDAQASGAARLVREMAGVAATGEGWQSRLTSRIGRLYLLIEGYRRLEALPEPTQADIRSLIGWSVPEEEVLAGTPVRDHWQVVGQRAQEEERLTVQRTWLWGRSTGRPALLLKFAAPGQQLGAEVLPGCELDAELCFYPGASPLRALIKTRLGDPGPAAEVTGGGSITAALSTYAAALAANPWHDTFPLLIERAVPYRVESRWLVADGEGRALRLSPRFTQAWRLLAHSGGHPVTLSGEWDGETLLPLGSWTDSRFVPL